MPREYLSLLRDVHKEASKLDGNDRPLKRRGVARKSTEPESSKTQNKDTEASDAQPVGKKLAASPSESEDDDDVEWEEVDVEDSAGGLISMMANTEDEDEDNNVVVNLQETPSVSTRAKRTVLSREEKLQRQFMHMLDLLALLSHGAVRNRWCNDAVVKASYQRVFPSITLQELHPPSHLSDSLKSRKFMDGLRHAASFWQSRFVVTSKGLYMTLWRDLYRKDRIIERRTDKGRFRKCLTKFRGSSDIAAQAFCLALRAIDIDARLVFSLQPLDFTSNEATTRKENTDTAATEQKDDAGDYWKESNTDDPSRQIPKRAPTSERPMNKSAYPVFWVEAWDRYDKKWITVDPVITNSVAYVRRQSVLEPPASDSSNQLRYVVAYESDGTARDVTRRYAFRYNSKTRKKRITLTEDGARWWQRVMNFMGPEHKKERDLAEDRYLRNREESEEMPSSLQDFKNHPKFVLEMHLRQNELLHEKIPCGRLARKGKNGKTESIPIFRREGVRVVKSSQQWYKLGRLIKPGVQPLKYTAPKMRQRRKEIEDDEELDAHVPMYSEDQTELYVPPPVVDGIVPKNRHGNIDVYAPTMIPIGGVHLTHDHVEIAAKLIGVDFARAVVGFDFNRGQTLPKFKGIVVATEYKDAVMAVYEQLLHEQEEEDKQREIADALLRWRKYIIALRIRERLTRQYGEVPRDEAAEISNDRLSSVDTDFQVAGEDTSLKRGNDSDDDNSGGGFIHGTDDSDNGGGGFIPGAESSDEGGGFIPGGDDSDKDGGFIPDDSDDDYKGSSNISKETIPEEVSTGPTPLARPRINFDSAGTDHGTSKFQVPSFMEEPSSSESEIEVIESRPSVVDRTESNRARRVRSTASGVLADALGDVLADTLRAGERQASSMPGHSVQVPHDSTAAVVAPRDGSGSGSDFFPESMSESELLAGDDDEDD